MRIKIAFCFLFFGFGIFSKAQSSLPKNEADSLWSIWKNAELSDSLRLKALNHYAWNGYLFSNPDSAYYFAEIEYIFAKENNSPQFQAFALNMKGAVEYLRGNLQQALIYYEESLALRKNINDKSGESQSLSNLGIIYYLLGDFQTALSNYLASLRIEELLQSPSGISAATSNIGLIYFEKGDFIRAHEYFSKSLALDTTYSDGYEIGMTLTNLGLVYHAQNDFVRAIECYKQCVAIQLEISDWNGLAGSYSNIGIAYYEMEDYDSAINYANQSLALLKKLDAKVGVANAHVNLGAIYSRLKQYDLALEYYQIGLEGHKTSSNKKGIATALSNEATLFYLKGSFSEAIRRGVSALDIMNQIGIAKEKMPCLKTLYLSYLKTDIDSAYYFLEVLRMSRLKELEVNYFTLAEREKELFFESSERDFEMYYDFVLNFNDAYVECTDQTYNLILQTKGLSLKSSTAMRHAALGSSDTLIQADYQSWIKLKKKIAEQYVVGSNTKLLEEEANELEKNLILRSKAFSDFDKIKNLDWKQVRDGLKEDEAAVEFVHFKSEIDTTNPIIYAGFVIRPYSEHPDVVKLCTEEDLKNILGVLQGNNLSFIEKVYGKRVDAKTELYEKIWQPLEPFLKEVKSVYYSPTGLLHKVSFAAICKEQGVFLSDVYNFRQMGSTGNLAFESNTEFGNLENFLLMGGVNYNSDSTEKKVWDYLPGSFSETNAINKYLVKKKFGVNYFHNDNASESVFKEKIGSASIVHIATHGFFFPDPEQVREEMKAEKESEKNIQFRGTTNYANWSFVNNKNPLMRSGIVLANANDVWQRDPLAEGEDGILTAQEVSNLDLRNTKLVVLSACETGLGDIKGSEGVFGLQRAFKMAGVKYLIMSLWQVPDKETSEFMILFYKNLIKLKDIPMAFQKTQKVMREKYDPYYWGAFVLIE
jgi:CHAT domain-containing protein/tetratricopeptide (TPR) repeat protein